MKLSNELIFGSTSNFSDKKINIKSHFLQTQKNSLDFNKNKSTSEFMESIYSTLYSSKKFNPFNTNNTVINKPTYITPSSSAKSIFSFQKSLTNFAPLSVNQFTPTVEDTEENVNDLDREVRKLSNLYYDVNNNNNSANNNMKQEKRAVYKKYRITESLSRDEIMDVHLKIKSPGAVINESRVNNNSTYENKMSRSTNNSLVGRTIIKSDSDDYTDPLHALRKLKANKQIHDSVFSIVTQKQIDMYGSKYKELINVNNVVKKMPTLKVFANNFPTTRNKPKASDEIEEDPSNNKNSQNRNKPRKVNRNEIVTNLDYYGHYSQFSCYRPPARSLSTFTEANEEGRAYLIGGINNDRLIDVWKCDLSNYTWKQISVGGDSPLPRMGHSAVFYKNQIFIFGGNVDHETEEPKDDITVFLVNQKRIITEKCTNKNGTLWRRNHIAECVANCMVVHGGVDETGEFLSDTIFLDLDSLKWREVSVKEESFRPYPVAYHSSAVVITSDKRYNQHFTLFKFPEMPKTVVKKIKLEGVYAFGGIDKNNVCNNDLRVLRVGRKPIEWAKLDPVGTPPCPRYGATLSFYEELDVLIVHGGKNDKWNPFIFNDLFTFDLIKITWLKVNIFENVPKARSDHNAIVHNNKLIIFGGTNNDSYLGSDLYLVTLDYTENKKKKLENQIAKYQAAENALANKNNLLK